MLKPQPDAGYRRVAVQTVTMQMVQGPWMAETRLMRSMIGVYLCVNEHYITYHRHLGSLMTITRLLVQVQPIVALPHRSRNPRAFPKASMVDAIQVSFDKAATYVFSRCD